MKKSYFIAIVLLSLAAANVQSVEQTQFSAAGVIETTAGGFKFPDGTIQLTAAIAPCTTITSLPYVINGEGVYCLIDNLDTNITSGEAITIDSNNVVLDLNGWKIDGTSAGFSTTSVGIYANQHHNITVRNGTVKGFYDGIYFEDTTAMGTSSGHIVEHLRAEGNTRTGITIQGTNNIIRYNVVVNTGGAEVDVAGIALYGKNGRVLNNDVSEVEEFTTFKASGVYLSDAQSSIVGNNRITNVSTLTGISHGIFMDQSTNVLVTGNQISTMDSGIFYSSANLGSSGKYMDNLTSNVGFPFTGGTPVGTNN